MIRSKAIEAPLTALKEIHPPVRGESRGSH